MSNFAPHYLQLLAMSKIEREKRTIRKMIEIYCRHYLKQEVVSEDYRLLAEYACQRLEHCPFGEEKKSCGKCPVHCYAPQKRQQIREVMRWVGPRMIYYGPKDAMIHIWDSLMARMPSKKYQR